MECGIEWKKTIPYSPQQNEVAKRMNKTLMENERSMLSGAELGQEFWVEAVATTCYLVNRSPSSVLKDNTLHEVWITKKPSLSHMRVFGYDTYVHVPKEKRTKLDSKYEKCIFIGYKDGLKVLPKELEKIGFELKEDESESTIEQELEDEEPQTLYVRRSVRERRQPKIYSPFAFCTNFTLSIRDDDPRTTREVVDLEDAKLSREAIVDEIESLDKNEAWDLVELSV
eukprot:PITA_24133